MKKSRFNEEQIIGILKEAQARIAVETGCARHNISAGTGSLKLVSDETPRDLGGWLYTVEFQTVCDDTLHKICLTAKSDFEAFLDWVQRNQATGVVINSTAERKPAGAGKKESAGLPGGIALRPVVMLGLFEAMVERKICGQFVVGNEGIVQGANMRPETLRLNESWVFLSEERCGMHLRRSEVTTVRLRPVEWEQGTHWVLNAKDSTGRPLCVLAPPREKSAGSWDDFLTETTAPYHLH